LDKEIKKLWNALERDYYANFEVDDKVGDLKDLMVESYTSLKVHYEWKEEA
jgi:hypothetical protein